MNQIFTKSLSAHPFPETQGQNDTNPFSCKPINCPKTMSSTRP
jgi:hypothetical protein